MALDVFLALDTQWRCGPIGPTGLDYCAIDPVMRLRGIEKRDRADVFEAVRIMEGAALAAMRDRK